MVVKVGPYIVKEPLGRGATGTVYRVWHSAMQRVVALKVLDAKWLEHPGVVERFRLEMRAAAQLDHPNVVRAYDAGEADGFLFLALEYVPGMNLTQLVQRAGPLPIPRACDFIRQAALGLQHIHERGYILRDLKPSNLLATLLPGEDGEPGATDRLPLRPLLGPMQEWVVKVCDLGIARRATSQAGEPAGDLTATGMFLGTADYCPPEQAADARRVDVRTDLYSLGAAFYYVLTGQVPFPGGSAREKLARHLSSEKPPAVQCLRPHVPGRVAAVVCNLMAKNPEDRYQTAAEAAAAVARLQQPMGRRPAPVLASARPSARASSFDAVGAIHAPSDGRFS
jgi:eukaryotic-like serine/threonine-protein kinase